MKKPVRKILKKLNDQAGASITFALLLFLVCAVVGSAVLVAGTAASGRMSKIAEMDQRYYAVNSAAHLLSKSISDETVTVKKVTPGTDGSSSDYYLNNDENAFTNSSVANLDSFPEIAAYQMGYLTGTRAEDTEYSYALTVSDETGGSNTHLQGNENALAVDINEKVLSDDRIVLEVSKGTNPGETYIMRLTFNPSKKELRELDVVSGTETITTTLNWTLSDSEVVVAEQQGA